MLEGSTKPKVRRYAGLLLKHAFCLREAMVSEYRVGKVLFDLRREQGS
jgi:hypothetical protein